MAKTPAERQRDFRQRNKDRINLIVHAHTKRALERLAHHHGVTQKQILEHLISQAESETVAGLPDPTSYYDCVTQ